MANRSPLDYDISVTADKRRRARVRGQKGETAAEARKCDWPGCASPGLYRAPKSPDRLNEYQWYCQDHIRDFNKSWNYFQNWSEEDMDAQRRAAVRDTTLEVLRQADVATVMVTHDQNEARYDLQISVF